MEVGRLRSYFQLQKRTETNDSFAQDQYTYTNSGNLWGNIKYHSATEKDTAGNYSSSRRVTIMIRYNSDVTKDDRLYEATTGQYFYVNSVLNYGNENKYMILECTESL